MKIVSRAAIAGLGLLLIGGINAMAGEIKWTFNDVTFTNGNTLTGTFITDTGITTYDSFNISVTGPAAVADFTAFSMAAAGLPSVIGMGNFDYSAYVDLTLASPLTSVGGTVPIASGYDCPGAGCGILIVNTDTSVIGTIITPEPSAIPLLGGGVILLGLTTRRRWMRAS